jgi:hypothetical protein
VLIASLLRDAAARLHIWFSRSSSVEKVDAASYSPPEPSEPPPSSVTASRPIKLVDRMRAGREAVGHIHIASPPRRRRPIRYWKGNLARQLATELAAHNGLDPTDVVGMFLPLPLVTPTERFF